MKKVLILILIALFSISAFSIQISGIGGTELGGSGRLFVGARLAAVKDLLGVSIEAYLPVASFESAGEELSNAKMFEVDPFFLVVLPLGGLKVYTGIAPIVIFDLAKGGFGMFSMDNVHAKAGIQLGEGLVIFADVMTTINLRSLDPTVKDSKLETSGIISLHAGVGLEF